MVMLTSGAPESSAVVERLQTTSRRVHLSAILVAFLCFVSVKASFVVPTLQDATYKNAGATRSLVVGDYLRRCRPEDSEQRRLFGTTVQLSAAARPQQQPTEKDARGGIDKVVAALRKDSKANAELGRLDKVTAVLGFGSPASGQLAVRFNASFKKGGMGRSSIPLPFGLGQSNTPEGRGTMVGQVKATLATESGRVVSCSVFKDGGWGKAFNLKV